MKKLIIIVFVFFATSAIAQTSDTIHVERVLVKNEIINAKNGRVMHLWWTKPKVKSGYIVRQPDGMVLVNGKLMKPNNLNPYSFIVKK